MRNHWPLDPATTFLNHGSKGACPRAVLEKQSELRSLIESNPVRFFAKQLQELLDEARAALARFVNADAEDLVWLPNASTGVSTVLSSLAATLQPGDELLITDHAYEACRNALNKLADGTGARVVVAQIPFPVADADAVVQAITACVTANTRLALIDHITSPTAIVFPLQQILRELHARGIDVLVDGAHAPGQIAVDLNALAPAYYAANCHKWMCAPKGSAFLYVRPDKQAGIHPLVSSRDRTPAHSTRSPFQLEFDWQGTIDPTPYLCVPEAIGFLGSLLPGGHDALHARNHHLANAATDLLARQSGLIPGTAESLRASMSALILPDASGNAAAASALHPYWPQEILASEYGIQIPVIPLPNRGARLLRLSAHAYNEMSDYVRLADALGDIRKRSRSA